MVKYFYHTDNVQLYYTNFPVKKLFIMQHFPPKSRLLLVHSMKFKTSVMQCCIYTFWCVGVHTLKCLLRSK